MRINRYLAERGIATRRNADALIERGRVFINGRRAVLGDKVLEADEVEVRHGKKPAVFRYYAYHKARSVATHAPTEVERDPVLETAELKGVFPVGRLDKDSSGLLILTDDGRMTDRLLNPTRAHEKEYAVTTKEPLRSNFKERMEAGVDIEGYTTRPADVRITGERSFTIVLTEGKRHQIRRMVVALHNQVDSLKRIRVMNIQLNGIKPGSYRKIEGEELSALLSSLGL